MDSGSLAEWFAGLAGCCGVIATFLAIVLALVVALFLEPLRKTVQRRGGLEIVEHKQTKQQIQLKTRLKVKNKAWLSDEVKVNVTAIRGRADFIEVPLVWLHWYAEAEQGAIRREIGAHDDAWVDFVTVEKGTGGAGPQPSHMHLDIGAGTGIPELQRLEIGQTHLTLRIDPRYGKPVDYEVTVDWDGKWTHPEVSYTRMRR